MKKQLFFLGILLLIALGLNAQTPEPVPGFELTIPILLAILAGCYEVISRIIPTTKGWSIVGKVLEVLTWLSNLFDRRKK